MNEDVFLDCGSYSEKLSKIANKILHERRFSGEQITKKDIDEVQTNIYQAYQTILSNVSTYGATNAEIVISNSVNSLNDIVSAQGNLSAIVAVADEISKKEILEDIEKSPKREDSEGVTAVVGGIALATGMTDATTTLITNKLYNMELQKSINAFYEGAKKGDINDTAMINDIERITAFMSSNPELNEKNSRALYAWMMRLQAYKSDIANQVLEQAANYYGIDIYSINEDGKKTIDSSKIEEMYRESVKDVNPKAASKTIEDFEEVSYRAAERKVKQKAYMGDEPKDIVSYEEEFIAQREYIKFVREINQEYRNGNLGRLEELIKSSPEYATRATNDIFSWQQNSLKPARKEQLMQQGLVMGNMLTSIKKEKSDLDIENLTKKVNMFEHTQQRDSQEDDYQL